MFRSAATIIVLSAMALLVALVVFGPGPADAQRTTRTEQITGDTVIRGDVTVTAGKRFIIEGATDNDFECFVGAEDPTADRTVTLPNQTGTAIVSPGGNPEAASAVWGITDGLRFEGPTVNGFEVDLVAADAAADVTVTIPVSATTTLAGLAVAQTFTAAQTFSGDITANDAGADTFLIGQSGATDDTVTVAGDVSLTDDQWSVSAAGLFSAATTYTCTGACTYDAGGAAGVTIGSADVTALTVTTDGTGTAEVALPAGSIDSTEILDATVADADISATAAIAFSKLAALASGNILVGSAGTVATSVAISSDATLAASGALTISANAVAMAADTSGNFVNSITAGAGLASTGATTGEDITHTISTASTEADFLTDGGATDLVCGAAAGGKMQVMDNGVLQFCDGAATPALARAALGSSTGEAISLACSGCVAASDLAANTVTATELADTLTLDAALVVTGDTAGETVTVNAVDNSATSFLVQNNADGSDFLLVSTLDTGETMVCGNATMDSFTVTTDGTGTAEVVLPAGSIDSTEILDGTIVAADITDITRSEQLPMAAWSGCSGTAFDLHDGSSGADTNPDIIPGSAGTTAGSTAIQWDVTGGSLDVDKVCVSVVLPADYVSAGTFRLLFLDTATNDHTHDADTLVHATGSAEDTTQAAATTANGPSGSTTTTTCSGSETAGAVYGCDFTFEAASAGNIVVFSYARAAGTEATTLLGAEFRYTATE